MQIHIKTPESLYYYVDVCIRFPVKTGLLSLIFRCEMNTFVYVFLFPDKTIKLSV